MVHAQRHSLSAGSRILIGAALVSLVMGSVHAFSIFIAPLEVLTGAGRGAVSLTYSFTLIAITAAVLSGRWIFASLSPSSLILAASLLAAAGLGLAASGSSLPTVWLGYSLLFGFANGIGYGFGLQFSAQANPGREGWSMGLVTAAYGAGATLGPYPFDAALAHGGLALAFISLSVAVLLAGLFAALLFRRAGLRYRGPGPSARIELPRERLASLWLAYGTAVFAGLMAIGHASGVAVENGAAAFSWLAPTLVAFANMIFSVWGGRLADRVDPARLTRIFPLISAIALIAILTHPTLTLPGLALIGGAYGATIAVYPALIAKAYGPEASATVYGRVFTAWGAAGLAGPWLAGAIFDHAGDYSAALALAALIAGSSVLLARRNL